MALEEASLESTLFLGVRKMGGRCVKLTIKHWPDRMVLLPHGRIVFVEMKAPGEKARKGQIRMHIRLRNLGFETLVLDSYLTVKEALREWNENTLPRSTSINSERLMQSLISEHLPSF